MKANAGLWIDHRRTYIVFGIEGMDKKLEIRSQVESQPGRIDGVRSNEPFEWRQVPADDSRQRKYAGDLNHYYAEVIEAVRDAESIFIFGPGEAKTELMMHLKRARLGDKVSAVETADAMTDPQITEKIHAHFKNVPVH